ncbi:hypothetical protein L195_g041447 [Trifolium pratense]|uniref:Uncharacterized protein n=1 Tax=Trifolium pratense TaxID=57577 RepID=A0A2K3M3L3_TRIPR|nr:hypothetical protein L195_g041447 [Trifolium pratense]
MPLGSIVKVLVANSFAGCVGNLYKSVENLVPTSVLLNPGVAPHFGCPNQPLNIPDIQPPLTTYYYGTGLPLQVSPNKSREGVVGLVKKAALYGVGDDLTVKPLSANSCLSYFKESSIPLDDLEVKVISIGEVEALSLLRASLTSKFTLTSGLGDLHYQSAEVRSFCFEQ